MEHLRETGLYGKLRDIQKIIFPPKQELSPLKQGADVLRTNAEFQWSISWETRWGELSKKRLLGMMGEISQFIGLVPAEADKIKVIFADNMPHLVDGRPDYSTAVCEITNDRYKKYRIILNRSQIIAQGSAAMDARRFSIIKLSREDAYLPPMPECVFEKPWELIAWLMAKELAYAQLELRAISSDVYQAMPDEYKTLFSQSLRAPEYRDALDLNEVKASQVALQTLTLLAKSRNPQREQYFQDLYNQSKEDDLIIPNTTKVSRQTFIDS